MNNAKKQNIIKKHGITRVCHLTPVENVAKILNDELGIRATSLLDEGSKVCDAQRIDGHLDHVCCSIQYPNTTYLKRKSCEFKSWALFLIDPSVILEKGTCFCPFNSATGSGKYITDSEDVFEYMFADKVNQPRRYDMVPHERTKRMPANMTTDIQAEVMPYGGIPCEKILAVVFKDTDSLKVCKKELDEKGIGYPDLVLSPDLFTEDAYYRLIHNGIPMKERIIHKGTR